MLASAIYREHRKGNRYDTRMKRATSENSSIEENVTENSSENVEGEVSEIHTLIQEAVNEEIKGFIAPLTS